MITAAAADELVLAHPKDPVDTATAATILIGPALFLLGTAMFKWAIWRSVSRSRLIAVPALCALIPLAFATSALALAAAATAIVVAVAWADTRAARRVVG